MGNLISIVIIKTIEMFQRDKPYKCDSAVCGLTVTNLSQNNESALFVLILRCKFVLIILN